MERVILLFLAILYSFLRGFGEGQTMFFPNVREHPLFNLYHLSRIAEAITLCAASWFLFGHHIADISKMIIFLSGVALLSWEAFELSYLWTRCGQASGHENFLGLLSIDSPQVIFGIHVLRFVAGTVLAMVGKWSE